MSLPDYNEETLLVEAARLAPAEAIEYFRSKGFKITWDWRETLDDVNNKVFQVARASTMDILQDIRDGVDTALKEGKTFRQFRKDIEPILDKKGWTGRKLLSDIKTKETKSVQLGTPNRLETIYRTNTQSAYNAGRWTDQWRNRINRPYLQLIEILDGATRTTHRRMSGTTARINSSIWARWYPPNGFNCRGRVKALTEIQGKKAGLKAPGKFEPDKGFSNNPGFGLWKPKKAKYDNDLWEAGKKLKTQPL